MAAAAGAVTSGERAARERRAARYRLRDALRPHTPLRRVRSCGRVRYAPDVALVADQTGRGRYCGLVSCASVWSCPVCAAAICAERVADLQALSKAARAEGDAVYMVTCTVRHAWSHDLRVTRRGVTRAWTRIVRGAPWRRFCARFGVVGYVRALEVTHGPNGWHPHVHALFVAAPPDAAGVDLEAEGAEWLETRWRQCVERELGAEQAPDAWHGLRVRFCNIAEYIAKIGLEVGNTMAKGASEGHRTPWQIAADLAATGSPEDAALWSRYCVAMRGSRQLTWSRELARWVKVLGRDAARSDEAILEAAEREAAALASRYVVPGATWDRIRDLPGVSADLLAVYEARGRPGAHEYIRDTLAWLDRLRSHVATSGGT